MSKIIQATVILYYSGYCTESFFSLIYNLFYDKFNFTESDLINLTIIKVYITTAKIILR